MTDFGEALGSLAAHQRPGSQLTKQLSGLSPRQLRELSAVWSGLPDRERMNLVATLRHQAEQDVLVDFDPVYEMAMDDPNADVRRMAVGASLNDESLSLLAKVLRLCAHDPDVMVRGAAAERLGRFAYEAEVGKLPAESAREIERVLIDRVQSETEDTSVRAFALSSAGYFSTEAVREEIRRALTRSGLLMAALRAIGRNIDPSWTTALTEQMRSGDPAIRLEAATAAAEYEELVEGLAELVDDHDLSVRLAAISSLGKTGGDEAREILVYCYEGTDPVIREAAARALKEIEENEDPMGSAGFMQRD